MAKYFHRVCYESLVNEFGPHIEWRITAGPDDTVWLQARRPGEMAWLNVLFLSSDNGEVVRVANSEGLKHLGLPVEDSRIRVV